MVASAAVGSRQVGALSVDAVGGVGALVHVLCAVGTLEFGGALALVAVDAIAAHAPILAGG